MATIIPCSAKSKVMKQYYYLVQDYVEKGNIPQTDLSPDELKVLELLGKTIEKFRYDVLIKRYVNHEDIQHINLLPEEAEIIRLAGGSIEKFRCDILVQQFVDNPNRNELTPDEIKMIGEANQFGNDLKQRAKERRRQIDETTMEERQKAREQNPEEYKELQERYFQKLKHMNETLSHNRDRRHSNTLDFDTVKVQEFGEQPDKNDIIQGLAKYSDYYPSIIDDYCAYVRSYELIKRKMLRLNIKQCITSNGNPIVTLEDWEAARQAMQAERTCPISLQEEVGGKK